MTLGVSMVLGVLLLTFWTTTLTVSAGEMDYTDSLPLTLEGENVHTYDWSDSTPLVNGRRSIVEGESFNGGCTFHLTETAGPNVTKMVTRELAYDPTTCQVLISTAKTTSHTSGTTNSLAKLLGGGGGASMAKDEDGGGGGTIATKRRNWEGLWREVAHAPVNRSYSSLKWRYNTGTDTVEMLQSRCVLGWTEQTGWSVGYYSGCQRGYFDDNSEYEVKSSTRYENSIFPCAVDDGVLLIGANTKIYNHRLVGHGSGGITTSTSMSKWGDCAYLLRSETTLSIGY